MPDSVNTVAGHRVNHSAKVPILYTIPCLNKYKLYSETVGI